MLNLDTNILLALVEGQLRSDEKREIEDDPAWGISAIVFWELAKLTQQGRIRVRLGDERLTQLFREMTIWPLSIEVAQATLRLDFASDPADEIIAATSIVHGAPLLTRDDRILRSKIVPLAAH